MILVVRRNVELLKVRKMNFNGVNGANIGRIKCCNGGKFKIGAI